jgi:hypothetical protein
VESPAFSPSSGAAKLNTLRAHPMKAAVWRARMYQRGSQFHPPAEALDAELTVRVKGKMIKQSLTDPAEDDR